MSTDPLGIEFRRAGTAPDVLHLDEAGQVIEGLRRFITHDLLLKSAIAYKENLKTIGGVRIARMRERQPLIEAFQAYESATMNRLRPLRKLSPEIAGLANIAGHCCIVAPTLSGSIERHHRNRLLSLAGQLKPLLLEWKTASHFAKAYGADIAWVPADQSGPEFVVRVDGEEWEVECKRQSSMVVELLGDAEADEIANIVIESLIRRDLQGQIRIRIPAVINVQEIRTDIYWSEALRQVGVGKFDADLPIGLHLEGELRKRDGSLVDSREWHLDMQQRKLDDSRLYANAGAVGIRARDPIELHMAGPRRNSADLFEYLWERKFVRAATQCTGVRGAMLVFEWEGFNDASIFKEPIFQELFYRTFDKYRHVAAIAMRCDNEPASIKGGIDYSSAAYLTRSAVTKFPALAERVHLDG